MSSFIARSSVTASMTTCRSTRSFVNGSRARDTVTRSRQAEAYSGADSVDGGIEAAQSGHLGAVIAHEPAADDAEAERGPEAEAGRSNPSLLNRSR